MVRKSPKGAFHPSLGQCPRNTANWNESPEGEPVCGIQAGGLTAGSRWLSASDTTGNHHLSRPRQGRSPILLHSACCACCACCACDPSGVGRTLALVPVVSLALNHRPMAVIPPGSGTTVATKCQGGQFISFPQGSALTFPQVRMSEPFQGPSVMEIITVIWPFTPIQETSIAPWV